jgi:hypothetical protein
VVFVSQWHSQIVVMSSNRSGQLGIDEREDKYITVKPVYNEHGYREFPVITEHIIFTNSIDFFKN